MLSFIRFVLFVKDKTISDMRGTQMKAAMPETEGLSLFLS
jgi:hypothetical protein